MNVRFEGVYQEETYMPNQYIRFYQDGTVLICSGTERSPIEAAEWLRYSHIGNGFVNKWIYEVNDNHIKIHSSSEPSIDYKGVINLDSLDLVFQNKEYDYSEQKIFHFKEVDGIVDRKDAPPQALDNKILNYDGEWEEQFIYFENLDDDKTIKKFPLGKFGEMILIYEKTDTELIKNLNKNWEKLEPKIVKNLEEMVIDSERLGHLKVKYFQATGYTKEYDENVFHGTDSNIMLSFHLLSNPDDWDFFIQDDKIVHCQPVY